MNEFWDRLGISASLICILHCILTPILVISIPVAGELASHEWFHGSMILIVVPVAVWALWNGYRLHRNPTVIWLGIAGVLSMILALVLGSKNFNVEFIFMIIAGSLLASAHWLNLRVCRRRH